ncbi:thermonuclease family protein [Loktanella sp. S4079]|uniref:thermonuclease family protein n=1 Tax=Loktanella sp. S4079 TaxID=579483 RepID=UPI0005FA608A|nr:thermonuclease family protein [Loktanella sp. S4079]KJZ20926.1 nuclease [Loktanella sp. S4079]
MLRYWFLLILALCAAPAVAAPSGAIRVIDADTIDVGGVRVRLFGIDAPEMGQPCSRSQTTWDCGAWARDAVATYFEGRHADCRQIDRDRYDRVVAVCSVDGTDMGGQIVESGLAWAFRTYSSDYDLQEKSAAIARRGLWAVEVQRPDDYRAEQTAARNAPAGTCVIKGNISSSGRIYHVPGNEHYDRTSINTRNGERWFCTRAEAEAAGWRAARR